MTKELRRAIEIIVAQMSAPKRVLEVGSRTAINQEELANLRGLFPVSKYLGVDMQKGPGVEMVANANELPLSQNSFELVLCLETLEHADQPWKVVKEIERVSKNKGGIILSSQQNFPLHNHPHDYFRYTPYGLASLIKSKAHKVIFAISPPFDREVELNPQHVVVVAWNGDVWNEAKLKRALKQGIPYISGHKPYRHRVMEAVKILKRAFLELRYRMTIKFFR